MDNAIRYLKPLYKSKTYNLLAAIKNYAFHLPRIKTNTENPYWYKLLDMYVIYPDGVIYDSKIPTLRNLISHMLYIKTLGCNAVHILPFLESPMVDRGFDVSNYYRIRKNLGTLQDVRAVLKEAERANIRVFMDLVFNHVSEKHDWFIKAQAGNEYYRNFFITTKKRPVFLGLRQKENAVWGVYHVQGKEIEVNIAFPEFAGKIPHWREGTDGYWYYHTYYPQELDLNWHNAEVFLEAAKVMLYWGSMGFNFRLDAIPFIGKSAYKNDHFESNNTFLITAALKALSEEINPNSVFLVETYERLNKVMGYFGTSNRIQANLSYNFHLCTNIWISLVTHNTDPIWENLQKEKYIPKHAEWVNFLRNHDELSLAYMNDSLTEEINRELLKYGEPFRKHYGIAGRTFSLLGGQYKRFLMAYFLLASFPGGIAIPYGDEIAYKNTPFYKLQENERFDSRNINRGSINTEAFHQAQSKKISWKICTILTQRKRLRDYLHVWPKKISAPQEVFGALYKLGTSELCIYINLSSSKKKIRKKLQGFQKIAGVNAYKITNTTITLGPYAGVWMQK